jgi:preprotein translocase subunit SecA
VPKFINKILRAGEGKKLKMLQEQVASVSSFEEEIKSLSDEQLAAKTPEFRERLERGESLDDIMPEAFAVVREVARRTLGMRHFDVQIMGGIVLHQGKIAEMKTGEGKTLVATLPVYLNALTGNQVHVVTVNDYLAKRDAEWMGPIYNFLGMQVGVLRNMMPNSERREAYACDIVYGTNSEFGFDYLRDNMALALEERVQRGHHYAIVDEVDSILIDEARTPLIISGAPEQAAATYYKFASIVPLLKAEEDYEVDEKHRTVAVTESGVAKVEKHLGIDNLYEAHNGQLVNHLMQALRAHALFKKDVDYVVKNGEVLIVDEFTGRIMEGRRYSEGLHQAIEAKEKVRIREENQTLATITLQNYFRMYEKLAGMTGTAATEADEFMHIYKLEVVSIPPNRPMIRDDRNDFIYKTKKAKFKAVVEDIVDCHKRGQPVLVGTISIETSEYLSEMLKRRGIPHNVLNAKHHEKEAEIIKDAGQRGAVTIATNMAGRGTDIKLGPGVLDKGGLYIIGTERHEARRIDRQLRGRSGRQGDPGTTQFYISLEDELMRLFGSERAAPIMSRLGLNDGEVITHPIITKSVERAQKKVEENNFAIRKRLLEYDDVMNQQRTIIYDKRNKALKGQRLKNEILDMMAEVVEETVEKYFEDGNFEAIQREIALNFLTNIEIDPKEAADLGKSGVVDMIIDAATAFYERKEEQLGHEFLARIERFAVLSVIDNKWKEHLRDMDDLKEGIGLRAYGQKDPLLEYKGEAYKLFVELLNVIRNETVMFSYKFFPSEESAMQAVRRPARQRYTESKQSFEGYGGARETSQPAGRPQPVRVEEKVGRNDPCPCGSGKKYKNCHGKNA